MVDFKLYLITDRKAVKMPLPEAVRPALEGGVRAVQLREKDLPVRELLELAQELRSLTREFGAKLFINDRVDVAMAVDADGVHLGSQSIPVEAVRRIAGKRLLVGVSTHSVEEAEDAAREGADLITLGPVYYTASKAKYGDPVGLAPISAVRKRITVPIFALGGITQEKVPSVVQAGADGVALISAILAAPDIRKAAEEFSGQLRRLTHERPKEAQGPAPSA